MTGMGGADPIGKGSARARLFCHKGVSSPLTRQMIWIGTLFAKIGWKPFHFIQTRKHCWWLEDFPPLVSGVFAILQSLQGKISSLYEWSESLLLNSAKKMTIVFSRQTWALSLSASAELPRWRKGGARVESPRWRKGGAKVELPRWRRLRDMLKPRNNFHLVHIGSRFEKRKLSWTFQTF